MGTLAADSTWAAAVAAVIRSHNPAGDRSSAADSSHPDLGHRSSRWQHHREEDFVGKGRRRGPEEGMREEDSPGLSYMVS